METGIEKAVRLAKGQTVLAKALGVSPQAVQQWVANGEAPPDKCPKIERFLDRAVLSEELNDKVDFAYIRATYAPPAVQGKGAHPLRRKTDNLKRRATDNA